MVVNSCIGLMFLAIAAGGMILRRTSPDRDICRRDFMALSLCAAVFFGAWAVGLVALILKVAQ